MNNIFKKSYTYGIFIAYFNDTCSQYLLRKSLYIFAVLKSYITVAISNKYAFKIKIKLRGEKVLFKISL